MTYQRNFEKRLSIAMVGVGSHSYRNVMTAFTFLPVHLTAVCDLNGELAEKTAAQYGVKNVYTDTAQMYEKENLDAVFICVSPEMHPKLACEAFEAGLHVWMEKPPALRASEVEQMIERRKNLVSVVGFKKAFMPSTDKVREIISREGGESLVSLLGVYPMSVPENGREVLEKKQFTNWLGNGCHPVSLMLAVGGKPVEVCTHRAGAGGGAVLIRFESGVIGNLHLAEGDELSQPAEWYSFFGKGYRIDIDNSSRVSYQRGIPFKYSQTVSFAPEGTDSGAVVWEAASSLATLENKAHFVQGMYQEMMYFCECVLNGQKAEKGSLEFALRVMNVYESALVSEGEWVKVP